MSVTTSVAALLGPTNTGKTHRAVQRMLEHDTGMIGLPLRLLARELYDRITAQLGELEVALVTGEEKRIPERPRYWICTVEAMPLDREVDFLAVDEIQLCAHAQRGHVFTDRLLHARGVRETWFLGADTVREVVQELVPVASIRRHPRFSKLTASGSVHLASLPPRSALVAFSAAEVYQLADRLRGKRGGAAVVLGALSPRTRNAQVAMYQSGEVDYLVATDAIGMGLNMDLDHVAFASLSKFDGRQSRALSPDEVAQIAGRAGRHIRDGTFGTLAPLELGLDVAFAVEQHRFAQVRRVVWRSSDLDFASLASLRASLDVRPRQRLLQLVEHADDSVALTALVARPEITRRAATADEVRLLWEVCEIPDFRKLLPEHHASLLAEIFVALADGRGRLEYDFMERHVKRLESAEGDIDTLVMRMQLVRTWRYVAQRVRWHRDASEWQARTERAEDAISEALHQRLLERFVDKPGKRRRSHAARARRPEVRPQVVEAELAARGPFAALAALRAGLPGAVTSEPDDVAAFCDAVVEAPFDAFVLEATGAITFERERIASLVRGAELLFPEVKLVLERDVPQGRQLLLLRRMRAFSRDLVASVTGAFDTARKDSPVAGCSPVARGLLHRLAQSLGTLPMGPIRAEVAALSSADRASFERAGLVFGRRSLFATRLVDQTNVRRRVALVRTHLGKTAAELADGAISARRSGSLDGTTYARCGYLEVGPLVVRADALEHLEDELEVLAEPGPFRCPAELAVSLGCAREDLESALIVLGYTETEAGFIARPRASGSGRGRARRSRRGARASS
ncbi:MAG: helicase [Deltaproteobacteria bacterium]|nr:helicase [Deltaproteobacteria bacterium]